MKTFYLVVMLLLLSACAPQQYQTRYAYTPPTGQGATACMQSCSTQNNQCKQRFTAASNQCLQRAKQQAVKEMPGRIAAYEQALNVWEARMADYERERQFYKLRHNHQSILREAAHDRCRASKDRKDCRRYRPRWQGFYWSGRSDYPGKAPRRPTLPGVTAALVAKNCAQQNQCTVHYNQCYSACGGTVKPYQVLLKKR